MLAVILYSNPAREAMKTESTVANAVQDDYTHAAVPADQRRGAVTMGLLWITMVTGFPTVLTGFSWYKAGLTLPQVITYDLVSCAIMLLYAIPACALGAHSGLTYALLSRKVFGSWGSRLVSFNLASIAVLWYGLVAIFLAQGINGIYHLPIPTAYLSVLFALLMAFNNFFGFTGVSNFARYAAGPILLIWVLTTFAKACVLCPSSVWTESARVPDHYALTLVSAFVIGYASWGNEADFWRFGKTRLSGIVAPLVVALAIGQFVFPITGWMMARISGVVDYAAATQLMDGFAFQGVSLIAAIVLSVCYFAVNDSCLYGAINAMENVKAMSRTRVVALLTGAGMIAAAALSGVTENFEKIASLSCVFLPCATVIIMAEFVIQKHVLKKRVDLSFVPDFDQLPAVRWPAVIAMIVGCLVGLATGGSLPGTEAWHVGVAPLQAWLAALLTYMPLRMSEKQVAQFDSAREIMSADHEEGRANASHARLPDQTTDVADRIHSG